jgi:hypothetical protein
MILAIRKLKFIEVECHIEMKLILMERAAEKYFTGRESTGTTPTLPARSAAV